MYMPNTEINLQTIQKTYNYIVTEISYLLVNIDFLNNILIILYHAQIIIYIFIEVLRCCHYFFKELPQIVTCSPSLSTGIQIRDSWET